MSYTLSLINLRAVLRRYFKVTAFAVIGLIVGGGVMWFWPPYIALSPELPPETEKTEAEPKFARSAPVKLTIPKIELETTFEAPLGLNPDQTVEVPDGYEKVGWYKNGPTPGEPGAAVILGHVDSFEGPAVFYDIGKLEPGDTFAIERADGSVADFVVDRLERYAREDFPAEEVYGKTEKAEVRLVTCSGTFIRDQQIYTHNLVVYATLVEV